jgi:hypothetical protein
VPAPQDFVFRTASRTIARAVVSLTLPTLAACTSKPPTHLTYDADSVATNVLALIAYNTEWARTNQADAVLYRIELRSDGASDTAPTEALYSFYSPGSSTFMTATSDPKIAWAGAEPQPWPADRAAPAPLPRITLDFADAWRQAKAAKISHVTRAVLEVNSGNAVPVNTWSILGQMPRIDEQGVFFNAISGKRINGRLLTEEPSTPRYIDDAIAEYRGALRENSPGSTVGCNGGAVRVPAERSVACYNVVARLYTELPPQ